MRPSSIWMPLYIGDYLADTSHLTAAQHGAYLLLLMTYWRRGGPLPDDDKFLANAAKTSKNLWRYTRKILEAYFEIKDGAWIHKRVEYELLRSSARSQAGIRANSVRWRSGVQVTVTDREVSKKEREESPSGKYAYENGMIKLKASDLDRWQKSFPHINVLGEIESHHRWVVEEAADGKNWFFVLAGLLGKMDRLSLGQKQAAAAPKPVVPGHGPWSNH